MNYTTAIELYIIIPFVEHTVDNNINYEFNFLKVTRVRKVLVSILNE